MSHRCSPVQPTGTIAKAPHWLAHGLLVFTVLAPACSDRQPNANALHHAPVDEATARAVGSLAARSLQRGRLEARPFVRELLSDGTHLVKPIADRLGLEPRRIELAITMWLHTGRPEWGARAEQSIAINAVEQCLVDDSPAGVAARGRLFRRLPDLGLAPRGPAQSLDPRELVASLLPADEFGNAANSLLATVERPLPEFAVVAFNWLADFTGRVRQAVTHSLETGDSSVARDARQRVVWLVNAFDLVARLRRTDDATKLTAAIRALAGVANSTSRWADSLARAGSRGARTQLFDFVGDLVSDAWDGAKGLAEDAIDAITGVGDSAVDALQDALGVPEIVAAIDAASNRLATSLSEIQASFVAANAEFAKQFQELRQGLTQAARLLTSVDKKLDQLLERLTQATALLAQGLADIQRDLARNHHELLVTLNTLGENLARARREVGELLEAVVWAADESARRDADRALIDFEADFERARAAARHGNVADAHGHLAALFAQIDSLAHSPIFLATLPSQDLGDCAVRLWIRASDGPMVRHRLVGAVPKLAQLLRVHLRDPRVVNLPVLGYLAGRYLQVLSEYPTLISVETTSNVAHLSRMLRAARTESLEDLARLGEAAGAESIRVAAAARDELTDYMQRLHEPYTPTRQPSDRAFVMDWLRASNDIDTATGRFRLPLRTPDPADYVEVPGSTPGTLFEWNRRMYQAGPGTEVLRFAVNSGALELVRTRSTATTEDFDAVYRLDAALASLDPMLAAVNGRRVASLQVVARNGGVTIRVDNMTMGLGNLVALRSHLFDRIRSYLSLVVEHRLMPGLATHDALPALRDLAGLLGIQRFVAAMTREFGYADDVLAERVALPLNTPSFLGNRLASARFGATTTAWQEALAAGLVDHLRRLMSDEEEAPAGMRALTDVPTTLVAAAESIASDMSALVIPYLRSGDFRLADVDDPLEWIAAVGPSKRR